MITLETIELHEAPPLEHHGSHTQLLDLVPAEAGPRTGVDAVIVPTARPTRSLTTAVHLAKDLGATCLALCSKSADAAEAATLGTKIGADVVAVETATLTNVLPPFETSTMLNGAGLAKNIDIALKRNLAVVVARMSSWKHIFFLDDDVVDVRADDVRHAAGLLHANDAVGLWNEGYPDNSVVCHANREAFPGMQDQFISTMALALTVGAGSFFPDIYNEDWFFFLGELPADQWRPRLAATGKVAQGVYDPFASPVRARREEFGDTLAEGLFWLLDQKMPLDSADLEYWAFFLELRRDFVKHVLDGARSRWRADPERLASRVRALEAALERNQEQITPELCVSYVAAWRSDLETWRDFIARLGMPSVRTAAGALDELGQMPYTHTSR